MSKAILLATLALFSVLAVEVALDAGLVIQKAHAVIGRPLTPMSYAGVARRTSRRMIYATSVYAATLPAGCRTVIIEGTSLHQCGGTYYQTSGSRYVVVRVD
ncbi:MAG: hypothetical protein IPN92_01440 [Chromatiaceae bacterium]|nr:hypothetical protein [Chromatiaceae bacterium]